VAAITGGTDASAAATAAAAAGGADGDTPPPASIAGDADAAAAATATKKPVVTLDRATVLQTLLQQCIVFCSPFAVAKHLKKGRGVLIVSSNSPFADFGVAGHTDVHGAPLDRRITLQYLTIQEYERACSESGILADMLAGVKAQVASYDPEDEIVVAFEFLNYGTACRVGLTPGRAKCESIAATGRFDAVNACTLRLDKNEGEAAAEAAKEKSEVTAAEAADDDDQ
jgi:hypothetical protein